MLPVGSLEALLRAAFPDAELTITDLTGTEDHYQVRIVSGAFDGVPRIARHRLVYGALGEHLGGAVHALSVQALAPSES
ncbi:MAG: BolA family transcriptional regulator [Polyangiaceae bacterium]|nr:BolA family transcriptional regulator [Polyangiaceae bacterium]MCW5791382.1 BolA family transcriptional regulator [Polyangiaceae bacterium]